MSVITAASRVTVHFELSLEDGQIVDSNFSRSPASFVFGDGSLLPDFESALLGMSVGQEASFIMSPEKSLWRTQMKAIFSVCLVHSSLWIL